MPVKVKRVELVKRKKRVAMIKKAEQKTSDEKEATANAASAAHQDNRNYLSVVIGGEVCRALFDPGATCSLAGASLVKRFSDRLKPSNPRIRTVNGGTSEVCGILPVTLEIDGRAEKINFRRSSRWSSRCS